jgi:hypothetical protein
MNELFKLFKAMCLGLIIIIGFAYIAYIDFFKARGFIPSYLVMIPSVFTPLIIMINLMLLKRSNWIS